MKIQQVRNATIVLQTSENHILVDPMLGTRGSLPPFAYLRYRAQRNPLVDLPDNTEETLNKIDHCLLTHSQTFGVKALQHTDHLDSEGERFLKKNNIPVVTHQRDAAYLRKYGIQVSTVLNFWQPQDFLGGRITAIPAQHGHGWVKNVMANGAGYYVELPGEPTVYIAGDTVYTADVAKVLNDLKPDIAVMAAGSARLDVGGSILMVEEELLQFAQSAPGKVIANHLEALNHCPTTRSQLKLLFTEHGLQDKVDIPLDGETMIYNLPSR